MVDLSKFLHQTVKVTYRNGDTHIGFIDDSGEFAYPYEIEEKYYTKDGSYNAGNYTMDGSYIAGDIDDRDIVEITSINPTDLT